MHQTFLAIILIWFAFILVYFTDHIRNIFTTLQPNPFSWRRWWAVVKGTFTKKTVFPLIVMVVLSIAIYFLNVWQGRDIDRLTDRIDKLLEQNERIIEQLEAQNAGNTTITNK